MRIAEKKGTFVWAQQLQFKLQKASTTTALAEVGRRIGKYGSLLSSEAQSQKATCL